MAIERTISEPIAVARVDSVVAVARIERTLRTVIETPRAGPYGVAVTREIVWQDANGIVLKTQTLTAPVHRLAAAIAGESVTLQSGAVISAAAVMEALPLFFDLWSTEDIAAGRR